MAGTGSNHRQIRRAATAECPSIVRRNILAAAASGLTGFVRAQGGRPEVVLSRVGIADEVLGRPDVALDLAAYVAMMEEAARETRNDNFGLWFGQQFRPEALGLIGGIALASPRLGAAVDNLARLFPLHQQATGTRLVREDGLLRLEYRIHDGGILARRQDAELTLGMFANVFRACLGRGWTPEEVQFEHARPEAWREHEAAFGAPAHFGQRSNALVFRDRQLDRPMPAGDAAALARLTAELRRITGGAAAPSFIDQVRDEIRARLPEGCPYAEAVAETLGLARWTLQRRLGDYGVSFSDLVDRVRRDLAGLYLRQPHLPVGDIAFLLGYSEISAFSRACRQWHGVSPARMRQVLLDGEG